MGEQGADVLSRFGFRQTETNVRAMLVQTLDYLDEVRGESPAARWAARGPWGERDTPPGGMRGGLLPVREGIG